MTAARDELATGASSGPGDDLEGRRDDLRPEPARASGVLRRDLVDRLRALGEERVVAIVAPAGYGKSTLLAQWVQHDTRPAAWLTVDQSDNDPATLLSDIRSALHEAGLLAQDAAADPRVTSKTAIIRGIPYLTRVLEEATGLLVLDEAHRLRSRASRDVVAELALRLPRGMTLAVATRSDIRLPLAKLRERGELVELSASDLAMTTEEATAMARSAGIGTDMALIEDLVEHTEGWPVGIHLTLLAIKGGDRPPADLHVVDGDDRFIVDYIRSELLAHVSRPRATFLIRSSVLDELSGPLCDFVLERNGSDRILESLERSNLLIVPLDHQRRWYRYHHLLHEFLQEQLRRRHPESAAGLHFRAATWYEEQLMPDRAVHHAMAAGDEDRAARLVLDCARTAFAEGRIEMVLGWLAWFEDAERIDRHPGIALLAAIAHANVGDVAAAQRWTAMIEAVDDFGPLAPLATLARALFCPAGIDQMRADATAAEEALGPTSDWYAAALSVQGLALLCTGEVEAADGRFALAAKAAERFSALPAAVFAIAARSAIFAARGEHIEASTLAERSLLLVDRTGLDGIATSVLPFVVAARAAARRGDPVEARRLLGRAAAARPSLSAALPVISVHSLLEMAEAAMELGDIPGARQVLREAGDILNQRSGLGLMEDRYVALKQLLAGMPAGSIGVSALTNAELRLLPLLATHLSFPEIGERLYVSRHTVKTQAMSIYRKLGASSRSEAVQVARDRYLLDG